MGGVNNISDVNAGRSTEQATEQAAEPIKEDDAIVTGWWIWNRFCPINRSAYATFYSLFDGLCRIVWTGVAARYKSWKSLSMAMLGLPRMSPSDNPFMKYPELGDLNPGSNSIKKYAQKEFEDYLEKRAEKEWYLVQYAIYTGGIYVYGGGLS